MEVRPMAVIMPPLLAQETTRNAQDRGDVRFALAATLVFLVGAATVAYHHELSQGEVQSWLIAKDSLSPWHAVHQSSGHGLAPLWTLGLYFLTRFTSSLVFLQIVQVLIAAAAAYLLARYAPWSRLVRSLFLFGYFPLYEFGVVCQGQAIGMLLLFALCALFTARYRRPGLYGSLMFLLCASGLEGFILATALVAAIAVDHLTARCASESGETREMHRGPLMIGCGWLVAGLIVAAFQFGSNSDPVQRMHMLDAGTMLTRAFLPIPEMQRCFWDSSILDITGSQGLSRVLHGLLAAILLAWCTVTLLRRPAALILFYTALLGLGGLPLIGIYPVRPWGHVFLAFVAAQWVSPTMVSLSATALAERWERWNQATWTPIFANLLAVQIGAGAIAVYFDVRYPFSCGYEAARYLQDNHLENAVIFSTDSVSSAAVSGYLGKRLYLAATGEFASFAPKGTGTKAMQPSSADLAEQTERLSRAYRRPVVLLLTEALDESTVKQQAWTRLPKFTKSVIARERYHLYLAPAPEDLYDSGRPSERLVMNWSR